MHYFKRLIPWVLAFFWTQPIFAISECCPTSSLVKAVFSRANPLPADGKMPYPVDIVNPVCEMAYDNFGNPIPNTGLWYVVTDVAVSNQCSAVKFVVFAVLDSDGDCTWTSQQALSEAKAVVANIPDTTKTQIDYNGFYIGDGDDGTPYYFDVCMFDGTFDVPIGTANTTTENFENFPIVMADMSPQNLKVSLLDLKAKIKKSRFMTRGKSHDQK